MSSVARSVNNNVWETPRRTVQCVAYKARTKPQSIDYRNYYSALTFGDMDIAIDSGASDSFGDIDMPGTNQQRVLPHESITMVSATNNQQHSVVIDEFDVSLPKEARQYHVMDKGAVRQPLLSVGRACDTGCKVTFDKYECTFSLYSKPLLKAYRDPQTRLYLLPRAKNMNALDLHGLRLPTAQPASNDDINVHTTQAHGYHDVVDMGQPLGLGLPPQKRALNALNAYSEPTQGRLMQYLYACAGFPTRSTWIKAIKRGYYATWPRLSASRVRKHLPESTETMYGHQKLV